jgi:hypothetical protein
MRAGPIVIFHVRQPEVTEVTWSRHSRRIERSAFQHIHFAKESAATSVDRESPLIEAFG